MTVDQEIKRVKRAENAGKDMAHALIEFIHLMYQKGTAKRVLSALIKQLQECYHEFE